MCPVLQTIDKRFSLVCASFRFICPHCIGESGGWQMCEQRKTGHTPEGMCPSFKYSPSGLVCRNPALQNRKPSTLSMLSVTGHPRECGELFWFLWESQYARGRLYGGLFLLLSYIHFSLSTFCRGRRFRRPEKTSISKRDVVNAIPYNKIFKLWC